MQSQNLVENFHVPRDKKVATGKTSNIYVNTCRDVRYGRQM